MTSKLKLIGTITTERLNNSVNGNPRYKVWFVSEGGESIVGKTASDHSFVYNMPREGFVEITYHTTKGFTNVFDNIQRCK